MALHEEDINVVIPDKTRTGAAVRCGFAMIRHIGTNTGLAGTRLRQSERLLTKLGRATLMGSNNKVCGYPTCCSYCVNWEVYRMIRQSRATIMRLVMPLAYGNPTRLLLTWTEQQLRYQSPSNRIPPHWNQHRVTFKT